MVTVDEAVKAAGEEKVIADHKAKVDAAKPKISFLHHIASTEAIRTGLTITLIDDTTYSTESGAFIFTDGISIVQDGNRIYFPTTSIKSILIHNPNDPKA